MQLEHSTEKALHDLFHLIKLRGSHLKANENWDMKIQQILSYLDAIDAQVRKMSKKKKILLADCGAGNCYLSFLVYFYYSRIRKAEMEVHCIDMNKSLMDHARITAESLGFLGMRFHSCDILDFQLQDRIDIVYSLHACDIATDKALYLGISHHARSIFSVSCCQHSLSRRFGNNSLKGVTKYKSFKNKILYMVADSLRAQLLEMHGYKVDIFDFVSSRYTDKNIMIRARKRGAVSSSVPKEYSELSAGFNIRPKLEEYLNKN